MPEMPAATPRFPEATGHPAMLEACEWNFDSVPDPELVACCYWEYARESALIRETLLEYRRWFLAGAKWHEAHPTLFRSMERIQSIGYPSEVFVRGCAFEPGQVWQSDHLNRTNYRHPDAPALTGSFPAPWQSLCKEERRDRSQVRSEVGTRQLAPFQLAHWGFAKDLARYVEAQATQARSELPPDEGLKPIRPGLRIANAETLLVDIEWEHYTNDEIATALRRSLKDIRPKHIPEPDGRGHKLGDWRANLTRLAAMRLLARFTPGQILGTGKTPALKQCQVVREARQFAAAKWSDATKWHDARREAGQLFRKLFPFLPPDAKPLSWERPALGQ
jgi:hypothetical protein